MDESASVIWKAHRGAAVPVERRCSAPTTVTNADTIHSRKQISNEQPGKSNGNRVEPIYQYDCAPNLDLGTRSLPPSLGDTATIFFFKHIVTSGPGSVAVESIISSLEADACVMLAIRACGMASLSNKQQTLQGRRWSRAQYVKALTQTNMALRHPCDSRRDETLAAVLLLGLYETLTCDGLYSMESWKAHIVGAAEILRLRGYEALKTPNGMALFREVCTQVTICSIWTGTRVVTFIKDWLKRIRKEATLDHCPEHDLFCLCADVADLRADALDRLTSPEVLYGRAVASELALVKWADDASERRGWVVESVHISGVKQQHHFWQGRAHRYHNPATLETWNMYAARRQGY